MITAATSSPEATRELGSAIASLARVGDLVLLTGDLGAGKTAFVQGLAQGLGVEEQVTSPTFTLAHQYEGRLKLHHLDVYRLDDLSEVADLDLPELLEDEAVTVIEWGDVVVHELPADYLEIRIAFGDSDDDRTFDIRLIGPGWSARSRSLRDVLVPWVAEPC